MCRRWRQGSLFFSPLSAGVEQDEVLGHLIADVQIDDPVHEVEAGEGDGEEDAAVLVNVRRRHSHHLLQVLLARDLGGAQFNIVSYGSAH